MARPAHTLVAKGVTLAVAGRLDEALAVLTSAPDTASKLVWTAAIRWHRGDAVVAHELFAQADRAFAQPGQDSTFQDSALWAVAACALGEAERQAVAAGPLGPDERVTLPALYALLSRPPLPGIEELERRLTFGS